MSKDLIAVSDNEIANQLIALLCAFKFETNKKRSFASVLALSKKADLFIEKDGMYLVGFSRSVPQAKLAMAALEEMRVAGWNYILFANGRVQIKKNALRNVLDCFQDAVSLRDPTKHCHKTFDAPMEHFTSGVEFTFNLGADENEEPKSWKLHCKQLEGHIEFTSHSDLEDPMSEIEAASVRRLSVCCPLYDASKFEIFDKPKKVSKRKKYWD